MADLPRLQVLDYPTQSALLASFITELGKRRQPLKILEAGCGRQWPLDLGDTRYSLVGVDVDQPGLEARQRLVGDLDSAILGDLRTVDLPDRDFDVIYSSYVLEHIQGAELVLNNFARWLQDDGVLLIMIPDRNTVWGFVTRITPYWFHIAFKRLVQRNPNAGKPGFGPFPTHHDKIVSREGVHHWCDRNGFEVVHEHARQFQPKRLGAAVRAVTVLLGVTSLGTLRSYYSDLILVLRRKGAAGS